MPRRTPEKKRSPSYRRQKRKQGDLAFVELNGRGSPKSWAITEMNFSGKSSYSFQFSSGVGDLNELSFSMALIFLHANGLQELREL